MPAPGQRPSRRPGRASRRRPTPLAAGAAAFAVSVVIAGSAVILTASAENDRPHPAPSASASASASASSTARSAPVPASEHPSPTARAGASAAVPSAVPLPGGAGAPCPGRAEPSRAGAPDGRLRAAGVELRVPQGFDVRGDIAPVPGIGRAQIAAAPVADEPGWADVLTIGTAELDGASAQDGARMVLRCAVADPDQWSPAVTRLHVESVHEAEWAGGGLHGRLITARLAFDETTLARIGSTAITVLVVEDAPGGPVVVYAEDSSGSDRAGLALSTLRRS